MGHKDWKSKSESEKRLTAPGARPDGADSRRRPRADGQGGAQGRDR